MFLSYCIHLAILITIYIILSVSLNAAVGYTGLVNFGQIGLYGVGAYTSAILTMHGVPFGMAFGAAGLAAALAGVAIVLLTHRLEGEYLALATLGLGFVAYAVFLNWQSLTNGALGIAGISRPIIFGWQLTTLPEYLFFSTAVCVVAVSIVYFFVHSRFGIALQALRDDELYFASLGKNPLFHKIASMFVSAFLAGIAGSLYAHYISFIDPTSFFLDGLIIVFSIIILGGLASIRGTVAATFILILLPELLRFTPISSDILGPLRQILYAVILLMVLIWRPRGLWGKIDLR